MVRGPHPATGVRERVLHRRRELGAHDRRTALRERRGAFLLGSGLAIWLFWVLATLVGVTVGGVVERPARFGLDFVLTAVFLVLATELWEGRSSLPAWTVAAVTAVAAAHWLPGYWYVLCGGLAGSLLQAWWYDG